MSTQTIVYPAVSNQRTMTRKAKGAAALIARAEALEATARMLRQQAQQLIGMAKRRVDHVEN